MADEEVPVALRRLWGLPAASALGRPAELDVPRIVRTAVELADSEGLAAATLNRIAKELGYTTMSLYRHVGSKDELLVLMGDFAAGTPPEIDTGPGEWRDGLRQWAAALRLLNHRRPWVTQLPVSGPPAGPNQLAWMDAALRVLRDTGLDWPEKVGVITLVSGYVRQAATLSAELAHGRKGSGLDQADVERRYGRSLAKLVTPEHYPEAAQLFAAGVFEVPPESGYDDPVTDPDFVFGLERILDGTATLIEGKS